MVSLDRDAQEYLAFRRRTSSMSKVLDPKVLRDEERHLRGRYGHGPQLFREQLVAADGWCPRHFILDPIDEPRGTILYLHGGGWVMGEPEDYLAVCRALAKASGWRVVVTDYAKAPECPFPDGFNECLNLATSLARPSGSRPDGIGASKGIVLAGDSAGGGLAAAVTAEMARTAPGNVIAQILITPVLDADLDRPSYLDPERQLSLTRAHMQWFFDQYAPDPRTRNDQRISPLRAESFAGLPPTFIVSVGSDVLSSEIDDYIDRLDHAGVPVQHVEFEGQMHGFFQLHNVMAASGHAVEWIATRLRVLESSASGQNKQNKKGTSR